VNHVRRGRLHGAAGFGGGLSAGAAISANQFVLGAAAADGSDRFIYNHTSGELFFDRDGTGSYAQVLLATLSGAPTISNADIVVV
jgi:Ca2+-binding RTX toxin-like protein